VETYNLAVEAQGDYTAMVAFTGLFLIQIAAVLAYAVWPVMTNSFSLNTAFSTEA
jgi:hypothetical protein